MPQGKLKLKKKERLKPKHPKHGDQQKLRKGNFVIKTIGKGRDTQNAQFELTKKITARIEQTMAARASSDGGGLQMVKDQGTEGVHFGKKALKPSASVLAKRLGKKAKR